MTREEVRNLLPVITAYAEGKEIELKGDNNEWHETFNLSFCKNPEYYRIKPRLSCRSFDNAEECWKEMEKHSHFGWIKFKGGEESYIHCEGIEDRGIFYNSTSWTFESMFDKFTFVDGSPFGVKEE